MYPVSDAFLTAVKQNTRRYYWTGKITTTGGTVYEFSQSDIVKGSGYISCQCCGAPMTMNLRCDDTFVEDEGWHRAAGRYHDFIRRHENLRVLYLELGVGANSPYVWMLTSMMC